MKKSGWGVAAAVALWPMLAAAQTSPTQNPPADNPPLLLQPIEIIGVSPLLGVGIDRDKVPSDVRSVTSNDIAKTNQPQLTNTLDQRLGAINLNDEQGSVFQPDVEYRGFDASPIFGVAQGLAVYQNGVRINEAFGDTVNWDLVPDFAIDRLDVISSNPVFGLNALGGAIALQMKNGFTAPGGELEVLGGSYGRVETTGQYGVRSGNWGAYVGASGLHDDGWRNSSPSTVQQFYGDVGYETDVLKLHANLAYANNFLNAAGPTPVELLALNRSIVFTVPQAMHNQVVFPTFTASYAVSNTFTVDGNLYYRRFTQTLIDGNTTDVHACHGAAHAGFLCLDGGLLFDTSGSTVPVSVLDGGFPGETDHTSVVTNAYGGSVQATSTAPLADHGNHFVIGAAVDMAHSYSASSNELGILEPSLVVKGLGIIIDQPDGSLGPIKLDSDADHYGIYATDTFDVTPEFAVTGSVRYNHAEIDLHQLNGTALTGNHTYGHVNPALGATYKLAPNLTLFGGWSMANRAPSAGELACSDPAHPCALDAFFVADPNLKQVVSQTWEIGLRGTFVTDWAPGKFSWNVAAFRTDNSDDIINIASPLVSGEGYFQNAGNTRRQGFEAGLRYRDEDWQAYADYAFVDATFLNHLTLSSSDNPAANAAGDIFVKPGDQLPLIPQHRLKIGIDYRVNPRWTVGTSVSLQSGFYVFGDESNQNPKVPASWVVNLRTAYNITDNFQIFGRIDNVFNYKYSTYGTFTDTGKVTAGLTIHNPLSLSPAPPIGFFGGARVTF